ncbi:hypothetical protein DFP72DRAFT_495775 [Ephemerocybe angulata]|uniref:F-box domain-containing protein n=1 Tax=Ephemerocybe angulata TaxID=980116 RepID=A0A8H6HQE9_9AGAR|nr:hypothetical protein DFP72DRAFT_495775 [Tulosesus angulatus]
MPQELPSVAPQVYKPDSLCPAEVLLHEFLAMARNLAAESTLDSPRPALPEQTGFTLSDFPSEVLSEVFYHVVDSQSAIGHSAAHARAVNLLHLSQVSAYFRHVAINSSSLWAMIIYIERVNVGFLEAMLARSDPSPFDLTFVEGADLSAHDQIWSLIFANFYRVANLHVEVAEGYNGRVLGGLLRLPAPSMSQCTIHFIGDRNVCLDDFFPRISAPFSSYSPALRRLNLSNCFISMKYSPRSLSQVSIRCIGNDAYNHSPRLQLRSLADWHRRFDCLQPLDLYDCFEECTEADTARIAAQTPVYFPSLRLFTLRTTSTEVCREVASIIQLPATCSRNIIIVFSSQRMFEMEEAATAVQAVTKFVPVQTEYAECAISMGDNRPFLRLIAARPRSSVITLRFALSDLKVRNWNAISVGTLLRMLSRTWGGGAPTLATNNRILYQIWTALGGTLSAVLSSIPILHLWINKESPAQFLLHDIFKHLRGVREIRSQTSDLWANSTIHHLLTRELIPSLNKIRIPLDDATTSLAVIKGLGCFLQARREVRTVVFRIRSSTLRRMGYAAFEEIRSVIRDVSRDFPDTVSLDWAELRGQRKAHD